MTIFELYEKFQQDVVKYVEGGDYCLEQGYHAQALKEYANALRCFDTVIGMTQRVFKLEGRIVDVETERTFLNILVDLLKNIIKCYVQLKEYDKASVFLREQQQVLPELGKFQASFSGEQLIGYTKLCNYTKLVLESEVKSGLNQSRGETIANNNSDETFDELSKYLKESRSKLHYLSTGISTSTSTSSCFIATAAYSTSTHPDLDTFREFRDKNLMVNPFGQLLVNIYYKISPSIARYVNRKPMIKSLLRGQLETLAQWMRNKKVTNR